MPSEGARRNLTLVAKVMQKLGSGVPFKKEVYLQSLTPYIQANMDTVAQFLDRLSVRGFRLFVCLFVVLCMQSFCLRRVCCCAQLFPPSIRLTHAFPLSPLR